MREFWQGVLMLGAGFGWWRRDAGVMARGLIPAAIVGAAMSAGILTLGAFLPAIAEAITPFADGWPAVWAIAVRVVTALSVLAASVALAVTTFTAITLIVGEPFYDRVWRSVERGARGTTPAAAAGFWRNTADGLRLLLRGAVVSAVSLALGLIPLVGAFAAAVVGTVLSGWVLADELTARALAARGIDSRERGALRRAAGWRTIGFGIATHLCMAIPLGAIVTMPAAVAGATLLAQDLLDRAAGTPPSRR